MFLWKKTAVKNGKEPFGGLREIEQSVSRKRKELLGRVGVNIVVMWDISGISCKF